MKFTFIQQHAQGPERWPVWLMCKVLSVSRNGYYDFVHRRRTPAAPGSRAHRRAELAARIETLHEESRGTYGSPRVHKQLCDEGEKVSRNTVAKVMKMNGIRGKTAKKRKPVTTDSRHDQPVADNLLERDFTASRPNEKWVTDITYIDTLDGWKYLALVMDLFSRRIIGWSLADHMKADLVCQALKMALAPGVRRRPKALPGQENKLIVHSDRGSQYAGGMYQQLLAKHRLTCSMSGKGNCYDNAAMESFIGTLKTEMGDVPFCDERAARAALFDYIEVFYNRKRMHSTLNYLSPAAYEQQHQAA